LAGTAYQTEENTAIDESDGILLTDDDKKPAGTAGRSIYCSSWHTPPHFLPDRRHKHFLIALKSKTGKKESKVAAQPRATKRFGITPFRRRFADLFRVPFGVCLPWPLLNCFLFFRFFFFKTFFFTNKQLNSMEKIVGHVVAQATTREFENGKHVVNFKIAENRSVPDGEGGYKQAVRFFECSYWIGPGIAAHLVKGKLVAVEGIISARAYINSHNGDAIAILTLHARSIQLYGSAAHSGTNAPNTPPVVSDPDSSQGIDSEDLPF
jgi:single-strand DNA-binding protein